MRKISPKTWKTNQNKCVENFSQYWMVFERYELGGEPGERYIFAPLEPEKASGKRPTRILGRRFFLTPPGPAPKAKGAFNPLEREHAGLFLEFARWFDTRRMTKSEPGLGLDTERNAEAALEWAHKYGVLGLHERVRREYVFGGVTGFVTSRLNTSHPPIFGVEGDPAGGEGETVGRFAFEAYEAKVTLKLFEAATAEPVDRETIREIIGRQTPPSNLETDEGARINALTFVHNAVNRKTRGVYPILTGKKPGVYVEEWGFSSLLAAMWLQMRSFMLGFSSRCQECGQTFPKTRQDRRYCSPKCAGRARARRNYHEGKGASSKWARKLRRIRDGRKS